MFGKRAALIITTIAFIGWGLFLLRDPILYEIGDFLVVQDELKPADLIHVIAGPDDKTDYALLLYDQGYAEKLFFTGGWCSFHRCFHGEHGRERALEHGIPSGAIAVDDTPVTSTYDEVVKLQEFISQSKTPIRSVIAVSAPHHMRRARWTYHRILGDKVELHMAPVPFDLSPFKRRWWADTTTRYMVETEYVKILYYYTRHQLAWGRVREWLTFFDRY